MASEHPSHAGKAAEEESFEGAGASRRLPAGATAAAGAGAHDAAPGFGDDEVVVRSLAAEAPVPSEGRSVYRSHMTFDPVAHMRAERAVPSGAGYVVRSAGRSAIAPRAEKVPSLRAWGPALWAP